jgi:predicted CoA-substrate-specific enzyme activase
MFVAGVDVGSVTTEALILNDRREILAYWIQNTGADVQKASSTALQKALEAAGCSQPDIACCISTGYGRKKVEVADSNITEISCHAVGAAFLFPKTRTIIDIGGQDSKVIQIDRTGKVINFLMNDKCAAGTGRFLEVMAKALEVELDEMGPLSLKNHVVLPISNVCTVFAESEVISLLAEGHPREDVLAGIHSAIARKVLSLAGRQGIREEVTMTGGVAKNKGVVEALRVVLKMGINVPPEPQIIGALGAALKALDLATGKGVSP